LIKTEIHTALPTVKSDIYNACILHHTSFSWYFIPFNKCAEKQTSLELLKWTKRLWSNTARVEET